MRVIPPLCFLPEARRFGGSPDDGLQCLISTDVDESAWPLVGSLFIIRLPACPNRFEGWMQMIAVMRAYLEHATHLRSHNEHEVEKEL